MKRTAFILLLTILHFRSIAVNDTTASRINSIKNDTLRAMEWYNAGIKYVYSDTINVRKYAIECLNLSEKLNYTNGLIAAYRLFGEFAEKSGNLDIAIEYYNKSLDICLKINDKKGCGKRYNSLAGIYETKGEYKISVEYYLKCIKLFEEADYKVGMAYAYIGLGNVFQLQNNDDRAFEYFTKGLNLSEEINDLRGIASGLNNQGMIYGNRKEYQKQIANYLRAVEILKKLGDKRGEARHYDRLAQVYSALGDSKKAHELFDKSLFMLHELGDKEIEAIEYSNIGEQYFSEGSFEKAKENYMKGLNLAVEIGYPLLIQHNYNELSKTFAEFKDFKNAYKYHLLFTNVKDSVLNGESIRQVAELETKYNTDKKESENKSLTQQNEIQQLQLSRNNYFIIAILIVLVLVIIIAFLFIRQKALATQHRTMELEQRLLRSQMNPHFIFNSLIAIESYIYKNEPKAAGRYLSGFAKLMRLILENSREEFIPLSTEIKTLEHYLDLQKNRFDDSFDYTIEIGEEIDPDTIAIPPMLSQPFIENSIEHGLKNSAKQGKILIRFSLDKELLFEVKDNGIGIERSNTIKEQNKTHKSMATTITMERLTILNKKKKNKISFNTEELKDKTGNIMGTRVSFLIPFREI
jgi:tetratricopeptide (TPR) repeat protein